MKLHICLVHHPTVDKQGAMVATSVTNLDVHDLSRAGRTYGAEGMWIVHPHEPMHRYVMKVLDHWQEGFGSTYNPSRKEALHATQLAFDLVDVESKLEAMYPGQEIVWVATSARRAGQQLTYAEFRKWLHNPEDSRIYVLVFGTGYGLHPDVMLEMDYVLEPIYGPTPWNHLSVRAAAGIILDRLLGLDRPETR